MPIDEKIIIKSLFLVLFLIAGFNVVRSNSNPIGEARTISSTEDRAMMLLASAGKNCTREIKNIRKDLEKKYAMQLMLTPQSGLETDQWIKELANITDAIEQFDKKYPFCSTP